MLINALKVVVFIEQGDGCFFAHLGHAGDIIRTVTQQRFEIGLLRCCQAGVALHQGFFVIHLAVLNTGGQVDPDSGGYQLKGVPVSSEDNRVHADFFCLSG